MNKENKIKEITISIEKELNLFEKNLMDTISVEKNFLYEDLYRFIFTNPKRLRPIFIFLFSKILEINSSYIQDIALTTELLHNASLIHDDIIDEEKIRRNNPTFYEKYGAKLAVLEGDLLLTYALDKMNNLTQEISKIFTKRIKATIAGEIEQNENINKVTSLDKYYKKTQDKTANLFFAGLESLLALKDINNDIKNNLNNFLQNYTLAFQINNDIKNYKEGSTDIKNGNYTLPMIYFFMENQSIEINQNDESFQKFIDKSKNEVEELKNKAIINLDNIKDSIFKKALIELTEYTLRS